MDIEFFQQQIKRLTSTFGEQGFKKERLELIWNAVDRLPNEWMKRTTDLFINNNKIPPLPGEFHEAARAERQKSSTPDRIGDCKRCGGYGSLLIDIGKYQYGFQCNCIAGPRLAGGLPLINNQDGYQQ